MDAPLSEEGLQICSSRYDSSDTQIAKAAADQQRQQQREHQRRERHPMRGGGLMLMGVVRHLELLVPCGTHKQLQHKCQE